MCVCVCGVTSNSVSVLPPTLKINGKQMKHNTRADTHVLRCQRRSRRRSCPSPSSTLAINEHTKCIAEQRSKRPPKTNRESGIMRKMQLTGSRQTDRGTERQTDGRTGGKEERTESNPYSWWTLAACGPRRVRNNHPVKMPMWPQGEKGREGEWKGGSAVVKGNMWLILRLPHPQTSEKLQVARGMRHALYTNLCRET